MIFQKLLEYGESFTHDKWAFIKTQVSFIRVYYIIDGIAYYKDDKHDLILEKNHLYMLPSNKVYTIYDDPNNKLNHMYLHIFTFSNLSHLIDIDCKKNTYIMQNISLLRQLIKDKDDILALELQTQSLFDYVLEKNIEHTELTSNIKHDMDKNFISIKDLNIFLKKYGYTPAYLSNLFYKSFNITPAKYLKTLKYKYIIDEMNNNKNINQIAIELDYSSASNLSRDFKKYFGINPTDYFSFIEKTKIDN